MLNIKPVIKLLLFSLMLVQLFGGVVLEANAQDTTPGIPKPVYIEPTPVKEDVAPGGWTLRGSSPDATSVETLILGTGESSIHGLIYYDGFLWASTRTAPAKILKIFPGTTTSSMQVEDSVTLAANRNNAEDIVAANNYIWSIASETDGTTYSGQAYLVRVDPTTMAVQYTSLYISPQNYLPLAESLKYAHGKLWVGGFNQIAEVDISDPDNITFSLFDTSGLAQEDYAWATALASDATHLWAVFTQGDYAPQLYLGSTIARIDPNNPGNLAGYTTQNLSVLFPDDMIFTNGYLYTSSENSGLPSYAYRFPPNLQSYDTELAFNDGISYGVFYNPLDSDSFWGTYTGSPGTIIKFDLDLNQLWSFQLPTTPSNFDNPSEIAFDESGNMYVSTFTDPARLVKYTAPDAVTLSISKSGNAALLSWQNTDSFVDHYEVWRSIDPYFEPGDAGSTKVDVPASLGTMSYSYVGGVGDVNTNYYYVVRAFNDFGLLAPISNRVGEFDRELRETTTSDFNWIGLPLNASLSMASDLATYIQNNSSGAVTVTAIEQWGPIGQNYQAFVPPSSGDFGLTIGGAYRVSVDVASGSSVIWSLLGSVPDAGSYHYTLYETTTSDFNWVIVPLDKNTLSLASDLKADIDSTANPVTTVLAIETWNVVGQNFQAYVPPSGDFGIIPGYPYRISVDVSTGNTSTWP